jgi:S-methyl-5-thioribose-1-phosphate isomerase
MKVNGKEYRTVWMEKNTVKLIDQPLLPHAFQVRNCKTHKETAQAIKNMVVRGAPAIGATAGYGMAQAALELKNNRDSFLTNFNQARQLMESTRPTAVDLFHATERISRAVEGEKPVDAGKKAVKEAQALADESVESCKKIGELGNELMPNHAQVLTHCNAGALATVDWGTALAPIRMAQYQGKKPFVFVDETRPRSQGARLTAWELSVEGVDHAVIADNAAGHFLSQGRIDLCVVGADRIAANGDVANKIGTYEKAVVAKENNVPFYVAAPLTTIDFELSSGKQIPIEERSQEEVLEMWGWADKQIKKVRIAPSNSKAKNPAFDVTPAKLVTGIITEKGVFPPKKLRKALK